MKTIAQQLNIKTFPFIIKDADGKEIYWENSNGYWEKREWVDGEVIRYETSRGFSEKMEYAGGKVIYREDSNGRIVDNRPKTDIQKAIDLLTKEGLLRDGKILKN
jgi:hypothetical protein